jgi:hypothetical protein
MWAVAQRVIDVSRRIEVQAARRASAIEEVRL